MSQIRNKSPLALLLVAALWLNLSQSALVLGQEEILVPETVTPAEVTPLEEVPTQFSDNYHSEDQAILDALAEEETANEPRTLDYSESLIEITEEGIFDAFGNPLDSEDFATVDASIVPATGPSANDGFEEYQKTLIESWGGKRAYTQKRLESIRQSLNAELARFESLKQQVKEAETKLDPLRSEIKTLEDQLKLYNEQISLTKDKITDLELHIAKIQLSMRDTMLEIKASALELESQKQVVLDYIDLMYHQEEHVLDWDRQTSSTLKLLLADRSISENLMGTEYIKVMEQTGRQVFYDLELKQAVLKANQEKLKAEEDSLHFLYASLEDEKRSLEEGRLAKKDLLAATQGEEARYQKLLEDSIRQQLESSIAIQNLKDNVDVIESQLKILDTTLDQAEQGNIPGLTPETIPEDPVEPPLESIPDADQGTSEVKKSVFSWPVPPLAITTKFRDATYPKRWGIHNAIDVRAKMQTPILAPANGYVVEAKDNGMGYSYIILAHKNNLITVYGHVYNILVQPGTVVRKGEVIGLTGGMPGTKGAGWQTTGPHLHFEVYKKGDPVDPLQYLPLDEVQESL